MTFKQQRMIDKLKRYFDNEDEYNYKSVINNMIDDRTYEDLILAFTVDKITAYKNPRAGNVRKYRSYYVYEPKGDDE